MNPLTYAIKAKVWLWSSAASWHFVSISEDVSAEIKFMFGYLEAGWGSLPVKLTIGQTTWKTSLFPNKSIAIISDCLKLDNNRLYL